MVSYHKRLDKIFTERDWQHISEKKAHIMAINFNVDL